jgi:DNA-binding IclR family transcriptional regulator
LLELGNLVRSRLDLRSAAAKPMLELHRLAGLTVSLHERQDSESVCLARTAQERSGVQLQRGSARANLTDTTAGRVMLIKDSSAQLYHLCQQSGQRAESVSLDVQQARQSGQLSGPDEQLMGQTCTATPLYNDAGDVVGALSISGAPSAELVSALVETAARISVQMGWQTPKQI